MTYQKNEVIFEPFFFVKKFIDLYFKKEVNSHVHNMSKIRVSDIELAALKIFSDTIDFYDQLPFENLLDDTELEKQRLLLEISEIKNILNQ